MDKFQPYHFERDIPNMKTNSDRRHHATEPAETLEQGTSTSSG